ncbi:hypothetical protein K0B96_08865 [Horticoccus luteus]|uniref:Tyr recombinase domain-containing protein n=1 Tax=Horticoccus luteus TaxID=2862869 RepID=A0A8F9XHW5_9BACT|nr:hypothetical protein [Horticoccus luteus]QYM80692.1 hypothetical protein K0B96_08865 [Horticoccus luteus]
MTAGSVSVKIYEVRHSTNKTGKAYVLAWHGLHGRMTKKFAASGDALAEARIKVAQLASGRIEGADMSVGDRDELQAARELVKDVPLLTALQEWLRARDITDGNLLPAAEAWAARNGTAYRRVKVSAAVKEFLTAKSAAGKNLAKNHASTFEQIVNDLGELFLDAVPAKQLDAWLAKWDNPVTRNTKRKRIVSLWRWAQRKGYLPRDARTEAEMTDAAHEPAPVIGIIGVETWTALLRYFAENHPDLLPALVLAGFCGLRRSEIHAQRWEDVSLTRKNLRITSAKRGTPARRMVPLCDAAVAWLAPLAQAKGFACPTTGDGADATPTLAMDAIRRLAREAKLPDLPENCFRHSYISHRVAATGDIARVSLDAGNSPKEINRHYRELVSEEEGKAWFEVGPTG